jgi:putative hydrolase of the HAD superfamily
MLLDNASFIKENKVFNPEIIDVYKLKQIKNKKFKLILCSNIYSERNLKIFLKSVNLEPYFDIIVASGTVGYEKPDPEIFKIASKLSNTRPERMIHIGDLYEYDYVGAESAGMRALLIDRNGKYKDKKINVIHKLDDVFDYIPNGIKA